MKIKELITKDFNYQTLWDKIQVISNCKYISLKMRL